MKISKIIFAALTFVILASTEAFAQNNSISNATAVTRVKTAQNRPMRRDLPYSDVKTIESDAPESNIGWTRIIYRYIDLDIDNNAALYYPGIPIDGQDNLFTIILKLIISDKIAAFEYLDGREVFTSEFQIKIPEMLNRFHIPYTTTSNNGSQIERYNIENTDIPTADVLSYYLLERWEFDNVKNQTTAKVLALCPVLHQSGDFGEELKYPMFWIKMDDLRPNLVNTSIFLNDNDNTPKYSYNDFFTMNFYSGDIYKTRNVRNKSMMQLYPDEDARKHASDSILSHLEEFDKALWTPTREEILEARKAKEEIDIIPERTAKVNKSSRKPTRSRGYNSSGISNNNIRSVRDRK